MTEDNNRKKQGGRSSDRPANRYSGRPANRPAGAPAKRQAKKHAKGRGGRHGGNITDYLPHIAILVVMLILIIAAVVMISKWNKGQESDYDPDEVTTEFDTEPNDYILPLASQELEGKQSDDVFTILTIGNSPFADGYPDNNLADAIAKEYDATVINCGIADSYITCRNENFDGSVTEDGVSLPYIARAIASGDYSIPESAAKALSTEASSAVEKLKSTDMTAVDCLVIMYNLEDYRDHRPLGSESLDDITSIYGAVRSSIEAIRSAYPYIRVVYLSQPAGGVTIDDFFVDGDVHDIGNGTLSGYVTFELEAAASASASFIDVYYGAITVDNRDKYLTDDYHINDDGAKVVAKRMHDLIAADR